MGAKILLSIITTFLFIFSLYLIITKSNVQGTIHTRMGWQHSSLNGFLLLAVSIGSLVATVYVFKGKKLES